MKHARLISLFVMTTAPWAPATWDPPAPAKQDQPAPPVPAPDPKPEPTLDELLGLPKPAAKAPDSAAKPADAEPAKPPADTAKAELERQLSGDNGKDDFEQAVDLMGETAARLEQSRDTGMDTQRLQKQALDKLDKLIDQARKQKSKSKSKSKSQNSDSQDQQASQPQSSQAQQQQPQAGANASGGNVPLNESGRLNPPPGAGAAWGKLPDRLRDALMQGSGDTFSQRWKGLTQEYYKRLAEQPTRGGGS